MSTARANLSVGPPYDVALYRNGALVVAEFRVTADSPVLARLRERWERLLLEAVAELPNITAGEPADPEAVT